MKFIITALTAIAVCTMIATAGEGKKGGDKPKVDPETYFKKLDTNGDGKVSKEEFMAKQKDAEKGAAAFKAKDKDGDGCLTLDEFKAHGHGKKKKE
ncbi:MAG: EF-hand domain-containing protein [Verrucomicrobia bacterium]|nr:EF-hand domain-containing protein [Verrucomicrobiota bacterium]